jgi:hypothetical protein
MISGSKAAYCIIFFEDEQQDQRSLLYQLSKIAEQQMLRILLYQTRRV